MNKTAIKQAHKLTVEEVMAQPEILVLPPAQKRKAIQLALISTDSNEQYLPHDKIAKDLMTAGVIDDESDFKQRLLRTILLNPNIVNGFHYNLDAAMGGRISYSAKSNKCTVKNGPLLISTRSLHNLLLGGQFELMEPIVQAYIAVHQAITTIYARNLENVVQYRRLK